MAAYGYGTAGGYLTGKRRRCGGGPSTNSATSSRSAGLGPRTKSRARISSNTAFRQRRKTRKPKSYGALVRKVQWNSQKLHGDLQRNQQQSTWLDAAAGPSVRTNYPLLFDITNFTSDNQAGAIPNSICAGLFKMGPSSIQGQFEPKQVGHFARNPMVGLSNGGFSLWSKQNADIPDSGSYYAVGSQYRIALTVKGTVRVRIQVFTVNTRAIGYDSKYRTFALPGSLDAFSKMCDGNQLPRQFFKKYKDFEKVYDPTQNQTSSEGLVTFSFHHNKKCEQFITNPAVGGTNPVDNLAPTNPTASNASGIHNAQAPGNWFNYYNVPQGQPLWMLISTNCEGDPNTGANDLKVQINRTVFWRDHVG